MSEENPDLSRCSVLVVEENTKDNALLGKVCRRLGFRSVHVCDSYRRAPARLTRYRPDLLIVGYDCDWRKCLDLINRLRYSLLDADPTTVVITAVLRPDRSTIMPIINSGTDDIYFKPYSARRLNRMCMNLVTNRQEFVVQEGYIGPQRGEDVHDLHAAPEPIRVPNVMAMRACNEQVSEHEIRDEIESCSQILSSAVVRSNALSLTPEVERLTLCFELLGRTLDYGEIVHCLQRIDQVIRATIPRMEASGEEELRELFVSLHSLVERMLRAPRRIQDRHVLLIRKMCTAITRVYGGDGEDKGTAGRIASLVSSFASKGAARTTGTLGRPDDLTEYVDRKLRLQHQPGDEDNQAARY